MIKALIAFLSVSMMFTSLVFADYDQIYKTGSNDEFLGRIDVAVITAGEAILNEDEQTANHANRVIWAKAALEEPRLKTNEMKWRILMNATLQSNLLNSTDNDIQFVVNSLINFYATGE